MSASAGCGYDTVVFDSFAEFMSRNDRSDLIRGEIIFAFRRGGFYVISLARFEFEILAESVYRIEINVIDRVSVSYRPCNGSRVKFGRNGVSAMDFFAVERESNFVCRFRDCDFERTFRRTSVIIIYRYSVINGIFAGVRRRGNVRAPFAVAEFIFERSVAYAACACESLRVAVINEFRFRRGSAVGAVTVAAAFAIVTFTTDKLLSMSIWFLSPFNLK